MYVTIITEHLFWELEVNIMHKSFVFRIYPNATQRELIAKTFGCTRLIYNHFLDHKIKAYKESGESVSYSNCASLLTSLKKELAFLKEVDSIALQQSLRHLDTAYKNFFTNPASGFPKFKSKKSHNFSYSTVNVNNNICLDGGYIKLPKLGTVRVRQHREIPEGYKLKSATVKQVSSGKYYVSVLFEYENQVIVKNGGTSIGLDFSMHSLFVGSNGLICDYPRFYRKCEERLSREQRKLSHMKKGSSNYRKQRIKVARIHEKVSNQRKDFLHKKSLSLAESYSLVAVEDLNMKAVSRSLNFGKSVADNGWNMFLNMLSYKLEERGGQLVKVDRFFPSSQTCSNCGNINPVTKNLAVREWTCPVCGAHHDRDVNAAINILNEGLKLIA